jgi:hypothetical protein
MSSYGERTYSFSFGAPTATSPARTVTLTVRKSNGQLEAIRATTLAEIMQAALAAQPAA